MVQDARLADGRTVAQALADGVAARNTATRGALGAVVGATISDEAAPLLSRLGEALILAPGVGAQGADMASVGRKFAAVRDRVLPSVSRDILRRGPSLEALRTAIDRYRDEAWAACGA
jgi:orotidine-5'-phosphate decarboxylase